MTAPLRIGIIGLGTVGAAAIETLSTQAALIEERCGRKIIIGGITARNKNKKRGGIIKKFRWFDDPLKLAADKNIDLVVEAVGGADGIARTAVEKALSGGKHVVTANKALIAHHGLTLAKLAEKNNAVLAFEAAVCGGIPIIKTLREGLAANRINRIAGILNGTCNYILTAMQEKQCGFAEALEQAQAKGYAEADPAFDIGGADAAHKLAILSALAYGTAPAPGSVYIEGIAGLTLADIEFAAEFGYVVKLLGIAALGEKGLLMRVHPCLVPKISPLATVPGALNAVAIEGDASGSVFLEGLGAGGAATASSIVADIIDIARGATYKPFTLAAGRLKSFKVADIGTLVCPYYLRLAVTDRPGVLAAVTGILKDERISLKSFLQHSRQPGETVQVVMTTHETSEAAMRKAVASIAQLKTVKERPCMIRMENLL